MKIKIASMTRYDQLCLPSEAIIMVAVTSNCFRKILSRVFKGYYSLVSFEYAKQFSFNCLVYVNIFSLLVPPCIEDLFAKQPIKSLGTIFRSRLRVYSRLS